MAAAAWHALVVDTDSPPIQGRPTVMARQTRRPRNIQKGQGMRAAPFRRNQSGSAASASIAPGLAVKRHPAVKVSLRRPNQPWTAERPGRMYAIAFDLDQERLRNHYPSANYLNGYDDIARVLARFGFSRQQGSVYFGDEKATPVICVMAVQEIQKQFSWFNRVVSDIRMLRIEENNDLMPAIADWQLPGIS